ncbi:hypothetical protein ACM6PT_30020, partial [Klebsiella pneumoniae]
CKATPFAAFREETALSSVVFTLRCYVAAAVYTPTRMLNLMNPACLAVCRGATVKVRCLGGPPLGRWRLPAG